MLIGLFVSFMTPREKGIEAMGALSKSMDDLYYV
jgi:hypothetical protein